MKKILSIVLAVALCAAATLTPAYAASADQNSEEALSTQLTFELKNDPTYTVTIPSAVTIEKDGAQVDITAENIANLGAKKVSVTLVGTDYFRNQLVLTGKNDAGRNAVMRYQLVLADNSVIETTGTDTVTGTELASFTEDGTVSYKILPVVAPSTERGVTYSGSVTYGIELTDID